MIVPETINLLKTKAINCVLSEYRSKLTGLIVQTQFSQEDQDLITKYQVICNALEHYKQMQKEK